MTQQAVFFLLLCAAIAFFWINIRKITRNIRLGRPEQRSDRTALRLKTMAKVAFGQTKMTARPIAAILHFAVYAGFILINIEILEIISDGLLGTHRVLAAPLGSFYTYLIGFFEWLAVMVILACSIFLIRRTVLRIKRFYLGTELSSWPKADARYILYFEILLMLAFLSMNAADLKLQAAGLARYINTGPFPVSSLLTGLMPDNISYLIFAERFFWWFHIAGILLFLNYLPYSKHLHIIMAFPNTYYSRLTPKGMLNNVTAVTNEVKLIMDPSLPATGNIPDRFGAKDIRELSWKSLMDAYTCTECGRCTAECPANITGKRLSPRKIMMDTRDRLTEVGTGLDRHGKDYDDGKSLLDHYISREEIWACTSCQACIEACPVNIDPLAIIIELRRYIAMEESKAPASLNNMLSNIENNAAPWKYAASGRFGWAPKN